jgi:hypothetical protein
MQSYYLRDTKMKEQYPPKGPGRPRLKVDLALILRLRDEENLGWSRGAAEYRIRKEQFISRDTFKRRYKEAKALKSLLELIIKVLRWKRKKREKKEGQR